MEPTENFSRTDQEFEKYVDLYDKEQIIKVLERNLKSFLIPRFIRATVLWIIWIPAYFLCKNVFFSGDTGVLIVNIIFGIIAGIWGLNFLIAMIISKPFVSGHRYVITTSRIILFRKFLGITFREIEYKRITDLVLYQSLWGRIWNFGNLLPVTAGIEMGVGKMGRFSLEGVPNVFDVRTLLLSQIRIIQKQILEEFHQKALNRQENKQSKQGL